MLLVTEYSFQSASEWGNQLASERGNHSESECSSFVADVTDVTEVTENIVTFIIISIKPLL